MSKTIFNNEHKNFMINNYTNMSYKEIGEIIGFTEKQVKGWLNHNGYTKLRKINNVYFNNIDTPIKAYFIGLLYADGYIICNENSSNYELGIELNSDDKYILEKLNDELGGQNIIYHSNATKRNICGVIANIRPTDCLRVYSKNIVYDLIKNGIVTNKTNKDIYPIVEEKLFFDFLRGYIDGDGCFYVNKNNIVNMNITCSSDKPLNYIKEKLLNYDIHTCVYKEKDKKYRLICTNKNSINLLINRLYYNDDLFFMQRKFEKVKHLIGFAV